MKTSRALPVAALALFLPLATACGGSSDDSGGGDKPSKAEISAKLQKDHLDKKQADCAADKYLDADLSSKALDLLMAGKIETIDAMQKADLDESDVKALAQVTGAIATDCLGI